MSRTILTTVVGNDRFARNVHKLTVKTIRRNRMIRLRYGRNDDPVIYKLVREQLVPLSRTVAPQDPTVRKSVRERLRRGRTWIAATRRRSGAFGFINVWLHNGMLYIDMLAVDPSRRGQGWGSKLLEHAERYAREAGISQAYLYVDSINDSGIRFYQRHQYAIAEYVPAVSCYRLVKTLYQKNGIPSNPPYP